MLQPYISSREAVKDNPTPGCFRGKAVSAVQVTAVSGKGIKRIKKSDKCKKGSGLISKCLVITEPKLTKNMINVKIYQCIIWKISIMYEKCW